LPYDTTHNQLWEIPIYGQFSVDRDVRHHSILLWWALLCDMVYKFQTMLIPRIYYPWQTWSYLRCLCRPTLFHNAVIDSICRIYQGHQKSVQFLVYKCFRHTNVYRLIRMVYIIYIPRRLRVLIEGDRNSHWILLYVQLIINRYDILSDILLRPLYTKDRIQQEVLYNVQVIVSILFMSSNFNKWVEEF
jgi:hypothetical protein